MKLIEGIAKNFNNNNVEYFKLERKNKLNMIKFASQPYGQETLESFINSLQVLEKKELYLESTQEINIFTNLNRKYL